MRNTATHLSVVPGLESCRTLLKDRFNFGAASGVCPLRTYHLLSGNWGSMALWLRTWCSKNFFAVLARCSRQDFFAVLRSGLELLLREESG